MSQICNFFQLNFVIFQDLRTYNSETSGMSECGRGIVITSAIIPEVDRTSGYYDKTNHNYRSLL